jgi:cation-transporting ATPase 13A3/4/5
MFEFTSWILEEGGAKHGSPQKPSSPIISPQINPSLVPTTVRPPDGKVASLSDIVPDSWDVNDAEYYQSHNPSSPIRDFPKSCEFGILKRFEFLSKLCRMSVVVKELTTPGMLIFTKGAPEVIKQLCLAETGIPS